LKAQLVRFFFIKNGTITPVDERKKHFPIPTIEQQSFSASYCRKFIPNASVALPLKLKHKIKFYFGDKEKRALEQLGKASSERSVLKIYCTQAETELSAINQKY